MKRPNLEEMITIEEKELSDSPVRATVALLVWLVNKHYAYTMITGSELAAACLLCCLDDKAGWKFYWLICKEYKAKFGAPYLGESDEDMGRYRISDLKLVAKGMLSEIP